MVSQVVPILLSLSKSLLEGRVGREKEVFQLVYHSMFFPKKAETFNSISSIKEFIDEKPILDFVEGLPSIVQSVAMDAQGDKEQVWLSAFYDFLL